jgi:hypothetical protein
MMNELRFWRPSNLDIDKIISDNKERFTGKEKLRRVTLLLVLDLFRQRRSVRRKVLTDKKVSYTPLSSFILQDLVHNYNEYLEFLIEAKVLESDDTWAWRTKCRGFRYAAQYRGKKLIEEVVIDKRVAKSTSAQLARYKELIKKEMQHYEHLSKWCESHKLKIDVNASLEWIENDTQAKINAILEDEDIVDEKEHFDNAIDSGEDFKSMIRSFNEKNGNYKVSGLGKRFYNKISNLKKGLRQYLSYDGLELYEIDFKNSQPFFLLSVLTPSFWESTFDDSKEYLNLNRISNVLYDLNKGANKNNTISMLRKNKGVQESISSLRYKKWVLDGTFYDEIQKHFHSLYPDSFNDRGETKIEMLRILFSNPKKHGYELYDPCIEFGELFPDIYEVTKNIQLVQSNDLALILQRVESFLVLEVVCKKIHELHPDIPMYTIHDSILTTKGNEAVVRKIMVDEVLRWTGNTPQVEVKDMLGRKIAA